MKPYFDINTLEKQLKDYYNITELRITVFDDDFNEIVGYPKERAEICNLIRENAKGELACRDCDKKNLLIAKKSKKTYVYKCHAGLTEIISPILLNENIIGYLFFAHVFSFDSRTEGIREITANLKNFKLDEDKIANLCAKMPIKNKGFIESSSHILQNVASYICMQKIAYLKHDDMAVKIDQYILENINQDLTTISIAKHFGIGRTKLNEITKNIYPEGIAKHIKFLRMEKAKALLLDENDYSLNYILEQCGFFDYNYFISSFKKENGVTPKKYKQHILTNTLK